MQEWPSGLRRYFQVVFSSEAWVRTPPLAFSLLDSLYFLFLSLFPLSLLPLFLFDSSPSTLTFSLFLSHSIRDSVAEWSKACDSKSLLLWRRRFESCRCRFSLYLSLSLHSSTLTWLDFWLTFIVWQCGRVVKAIDLKSISLWERRFKSCHCRFFSFISIYSLLLHSPLVSLDYLFLSYLLGRFISSRIHPFPSEHGSKDA